MNRSFIAPAVQYPLLWFFDLAFPAIAKLSLNLEAVEISESDREMLRRLQSERVLYLSNHPTTIEPPVTYYVANCMGSRFHFMASRAVFEWGNGFVGEVIKRVGAFSILAGGLDRDAIKTARSILSDKGGKLAIYPEGMNSNENDNLLPFQGGAIQIGFWALEDALKKDPKADIKVVNAFVKYIHTESKERLLAHIHDSVSRIESKLSIVPGERNLLRRFLYIGRVILEMAEKEYDLPATQESMEYRIGRVRHSALNRAAMGLGIEFSEGMDAIAKMKELFTTVESFELGFPDPKHPGLKPKNLEQVKKDMEKAYTFIVIRPLYLLSRPTAERMIEWLTRYETLIFGKSDFRPRKAIVQFAPIFGLKEYYDEYKKDKKSVLESVLNRVKMNIETMMIEGISYTAPIVEPLDVGPNPQF
jgi:1-acyl-sn-glycerol-3-phosphate acyltransferase